MLQTLLTCCCYLLSLFCCVLFFLSDKVWLKSLLILWVIASLCRMWTCLCVAPPGGRSHRDRELSKEEVAHLCSFTLIIYFSRRDSDDLMKLSGLRGTGFSGEQLLTWSEVPAAVGSTNVTLFAISPSFSSVLCLSLGSGAWRRRNIRSVDQNSKNWSLIQFLCLQTKLWPLRLWPLTERRTRREEDLCPPPADPPPADPPSPFPPPGWFLTPPLQGQWIQVEPGKWTSISETLGCFLQGVLMGRSAQTHLVRTHRWVDGEDKVYVSKLWKMLHDHDVCEGS